MAKGKVTVRDLGYKRAIDQLKHLAEGQEVVAGITGDKATESVDKDFRLVDVAAVHEFGSLNRHIPQRSFLRATVDAERAKIQDMVAAVTKKCGLGQISPAQALDQLGLGLVGMIRARIRRGIPPPLKPATIAAKAKDGGTAKNTPLIRTGRLINSITHVVRRAGTGE